MEFPIFFVVVFLFAALLAAVILVYLQIYKRNINRVVQSGGGQPVKMPAPYKVAVGFVIGFLVVALVIVLALKESGRITTPEELIRDAQGEQTLAEDWDVTVSMDGCLAAVLLYNEDKTDHTFKVYRDKGGSRTDYVFVHGGSSSSVEQSAWAYKYGGMRAIISMNTMGIAGISCHDGAEYTIDPNAPFALVIPDGNFDALDTDGEQIDLDGEWWFEEVDGNK